MKSGVLAEPMHLDAPYELATECTLTLLPAPPAYTVLSNKERRKLYDSVGHEAFLNDEVSNDDDENEEDTGFHFSFSDFFHDFDDSPFGEEPHFHWTFHQEGEDEHSLYEHYTFEGPGSSFYFVDGDDSEEEYYY